MAFSPPEGVLVVVWFESKFSGGGKGAYNIFVKEFNALPDKPANPPRQLQAKGTGKVFGCRAQYVEGLAGIRFIASAGPTAATLEEFWVMCLQEGVCAILQLNGLEKIKQMPKDDTVMYYPIEAGKEEVFGRCKVKCVSSELKRTGMDSPTQPAPTDVDKSACRVTKLTLSTDDPSDDPKQIVHICHYQWADGSIPKPVKGNKAALQLFNMMQNHLGSPAGPVLVHCHQGVGRTGTAIAVDICGRRLLHHYRADVEQTVVKVRCQRPRAVWTFWQYIYVNLALAYLALDRLDKKHHSALFKNDKYKKAVDECWGIMLDDACSLGNVNKVVNVFGAVQLNKITCIPSIAYISSIQS